MQYVIFYISLLLTGVVLQAQNTIAVQMTNFDNDLGTVRVGLYTSEATWLEKEARTLVAEIKGQEANVRFTNVPDGTYAVSCFHDEDNDGVFDMFLNFLPREDYGCSNGAVGRFGPPKWQDAKFEVSNGTIRRLTINL